MKKSSLIWAAILPALCIGTLHAREGDEEAKHGGVMNWNENSEFTFELVAIDNALTIYIEDHGIPVPTKGAKGRLVITSAAATRTVELQPDGDNRVTASGASVGHADKAVANLTLANGSVMMGRFVFR